MKTSINFKAVKTDSEAHNFRKKTFDYIRKELSGKNEYWLEEKIADRIQKIETYCKDKSGRKLQKNAMPVREAVVVIKEDTTMKDLHDLAKKLEEELGIRVFQIAIHKDEGHLDKDTKEWKPNFHAHLVADWQDLKTGKTLKHQSFHYSRMQDLAAECLGMERGNPGSVGRLEAVEFKIMKKEEELKGLEQKITEMRAELGSGKFKDLIVKDTHFLGFERIKTDKTIDNYEKAFKIFNTKLLKNREILETRNRQIATLNKEKESLKKEIFQLKSKNTALLTSAPFFADEKKKYLESVKDTLEKAIRFERYRNPNTNRSDKNMLINEMNKICNAVSKENNIPISAFEEVFKMAEIATSLMSVLRFGDNNPDQLEEIPAPLKKKKKRSISGE